MGVYDRAAMLSRGEFLVLQLLYTLTDFSKVTLPDPQLVKEAADEELEDAQETKDPSPRRSLWFDYPDTDREKILAVYRLIGEQPTFITPNTFPRLLRFILVGSVLLILLFFLYQICTKVLCKTGTQ